MVARFLDNFRAQKPEADQDVLSQEDVGKASKSKNGSSANPATTTTQVEAAGESVVPVSIRTRAADQTTNAQRVSTSTRVLFLLISIFLSLMLWIYIQINTNPVVSRNITVPIQYNDEEVSNKYGVSYPIKTVDLEIVGRAETLNKLTADDIIATIDYSAIKDGDTGVINLPITITAADNNVYFRVERQMPDKTSVIVYSIN